MSGRQSHRSRVSPTLLTLQPLEPRCLMAADAGFAASLAAGPRLTVAQAEAEATAGSQAAEQAITRREGAPAAAIVDPRRMTAAFGQLMVRAALPGGVTTSPIATETFGSEAVPQDQAAGQALANGSTRTFDHIGNFNISIRTFGADFSETSNI